MIRPLTCICMLLAGGSGLYLYQAKHRAQMLDREIERTLKATDVARDRIGVLRGEWALLNEPERLAALSQSHLGLKSLAPSQFVTAAELAVRLPPPAAPGTIYPPDEEELPVADALPQPPAPVALTVALPMPARPPVAIAKASPALSAAPSRPSVQVASILQSPVSPLPPPRPVLAHPVLAPVVNVSASPIVATAAAKPTPARPAPSINANVAPQRPSTPSPAGSSIGESVARMAHLQAAPQATSVTAPTPQPAYNPPAHAQTSYGQASPSALGGIRPLLPPPVPFGSAMAASIASAR